MAAGTQANRATPCLEDMNSIDFFPKEHTKNVKFGPTNNLFTKKTEAELLDEIEWMEGENQYSPDRDIQEMHYYNMTRLLAFEKYKEEKINE